MTEGNPETWGRIKNSGCTIKRLVAILTLQIEEFKYCLVGLKLPGYSFELNQGDNFVQILGDTEEKNVCKTTDNRFDGLKLGKVMYLALHHQKIGVEV